MAHIIKCRLCQRRFDIETEEYVLIGKKSYYHKSCYDNWIKGRAQLDSENSDENFWKESLIDYLYRDVKMKIDFSKFNSQWNNFIKPIKKMTPKGIYFTVRYYYSVINGDKEKAQGGIGIVLSLYKDACEYWTNLEIKKRGTLDAIINQIKERNSRSEKIIKVQKKEKQKVKWNLDEI